MMIVDAPRVFGRERRSVRRIGTIIHAHGEANKEVRTSSPPTRTPIVPLGTLSILQQAGKAKRESGLSQDRVDGELAFIQDDV
jgi:hypothetical protein